MACWSRIITAVSLAGVAGCSDTPTCCIDNYPPTYALVYGAVRGASGQPAASVLVRAGDAVGVVTDSAGRFRLPTLLHGFGPVTLPVPVTAYRTDASRHLIDSSRVTASIPFFATEPPRDSARVDLVVPWVP